MPKLLNKPVCQISDVINMGRRFIGVEYRDNGRSWNGVDCSGLLIMIARELSIPHCDVQEPYTRGAYAQLLLRNLRCQMREISINKREPGDWGVFWWDRVSKEPQHCGMFVKMEATGKEGLLHAWEMANDPKVTEHHITKRWNRRLTNVFRFYELHVGRN